MAKSPTKRADSDANAFMKMHPTMTPPHVLSDTLSLLDNCCFLGARFASNDDPFQTTDDQSKQSIIAFRKGVGLGCDFADSRREWWRVQTSHWVLFVLRVRDQSSPACPYHAGFKTQDQVSPKRRYYFTSLTEPGTGITFKLPG